MFCNFIVMKLVLDGREGRCLFFVGVRRRENLKYLFF